MTDSNNIVLEEPEFKEILTPRLRLRTVRVSDAEALMPLITRQDVMKWTVSRSGQILLIFIKTDYYSLTDQCQISTKQEDGSVSERLAETSSTLSSN